MTFSHAVKPFVNFNEYIRKETHVYSHQPYHICYILGNYSIKVYLFIIAISTISYALLYTKCRVAMLNKLQFKYNVLFHKIDLG